jgi:acetolactate synthase-1/2/3 large subunit
MARPVTKATFQARTAAEVPALVREAFRLMLDGRPGPVLLDLPKDVLLSRAIPDPTPEPLADPTSLTKECDPALEAALDRLATLLDRAERPVLLAGRGVVLARAAGGLRRLAERASLPTITTLLGVGILPESHPLAFGMAGMHGTVAANLALHHADLVIGLGARFDDRVVGRAADFAPQATIVHVDVDRSAFGRVARCDLPVLGDAGVVLEGLLARVEPRDRAAWLAMLRSWATEHADCLQPDDGLSSPTVLRALRTETSGRATLVADVGQHQMFAALHSGFDRADSFYTSGGLGTMGYAVPAAMGVKLARPEQEVWAIVGDGGFQMSAPELSTLAANGIAVKIAILNNACLGMVRQWQELFYDGVYSQSLLPQPDFARLAESHGVAARLVECSEQVESALGWARQTPGPVVLDFHVPLEETVLPMVPAGAANGELLCKEGRVLP